MDGRDDRLVAEAKEKDILSVAQSLGAVLRKTGNEWMGPCPNCGGTDRFAVKPSEGVFHCRGSETGGDVIELVKYIRGDSFMEAVEFLAGRSAERRERSPARSRNDDSPPFDESPPIDQMAKDEARRVSDEEKKLEQQAIRNGPLKIYSYRDEMEIEVYQVCRYEWKGYRGDRKKTFRQRRKPLPTDPPEKVRGGFVWRIDDDAMLPYRLPELIEAIAAGETLFISEGEKDGDTVFDWGFASTTFPASGKRLPPNLGRWFYGADVVLLRDNDVQRVDGHGKPVWNKNGTPSIPGKDFCQNVGKALKPFAKRIREFCFTELPPGGDVTDWKEKHAGTAEAFFDRVQEGAYEWKREAPVSKFGAVGFHEMHLAKAMDDFLVDDLLTCGDKSFIGGVSQSGKTFYSMAMGLHICLGWEFFGKKVKQGLVLYQAGESQRGILKRGIAFKKHFNIGDDVHLPFRFLTKRVDLFEKGADVQNFIDEVNMWRDFYPDDPLRAIFIDTFAKVSVGAEENSAKDMGIILDNIDKIERATGAAIPLVHHMNQDGKKLRGSTALFSNVEQVIGIVVDKETKIRTATIEKMKDGEAGGETRFELFSLEVGRRTDGKPITSCVIVPAGRKQEFKDAAGRQGFSLNKNEHEVFRAFIAALENNGVEPPYSEAMANVKRVVNNKYWEIHFAKISSINRDDDERKYKARLRQQFESASRSLQKFNIINRENPWVWLTGKPVRGFPQTFPPVSRTAQSEPGLMPEGMDDIGSLL